MLAAAQSRLGCKAWISWGAVGQIKCCRSAKTGATLGWEEECEEHLQLSGADVRHQGGGITVRLEVLDHNKWDS